MAGTPHWATVVHWVVGVVCVLPDASQHDTLAVISATAYMLDVVPSLRPPCFCHDSAADSAHLYQCMRQFGVVLIVNWNLSAPRRATRTKRTGRTENRGTPRAGRSLERPDERSVPMCADGHEMCRDGYDSSKMATKYRCPYARGMVDECDWWSTCTSSPYGRVVKIYDRADFKLFGPVPHKSDKWRDVYRDRVCTEWVNNRIPD